VNPPIRRPIGWKRRIAAAFTENLPLKAAAVAFSIVLWYVIDPREPKEAVVDVKFLPQVDSALVLRDTAPIVRAWVIGRPAEIEKLNSTPLVIRRPIASDVPDTLVMSLRTSDVEVPEGVEVIVRDVRPRSLTLVFEAIASRTVPVRSALMVIAPRGTPTIAVRLEPDSATLRGPRRAIARLSQVYTVRDSIALDTMPHLVDIDTAGLGVLVKPPQVKALFGRARS
jgi:hypothetical protein